MPITAKPIPLCERRFKLKIIDKRFGSKSYAIYDTINKNLYVDSNLSLSGPVIYKNHSGYLKARKIVDSMNEQFIKHLKSSRTNYVKAAPEWVEVENIYESLLNGELK